jgi:hypothetical protein
MFGVHNLYGIRMVKFLIVIWGGLNKCWKRKPSREVLFRKIYKDIRADSI